MRVRLSIARQALTGLTADGPGPIPVTIRRAGAV